MSPIAIHISHLLTIYRRQGTGHWVDIIDSQSGRSPKSQRVRGQNIGLSESVDSVPVLLLCVFTLKSEHCPNILSLSLWPLWLKLEWNPCWIINNMSPDSGLRDSVSQVTSAITPHWSTLHGVYNVMTSYTSSIMYDSMRTAQWIGKGVNVEWVQLSPIEEWGLVTVVRRMESTGHVKGIRQGLQSSLCIG